jgi:16S rRNA (cytosine967-C5)-methyltransferase
VTLLRDAWALAIDALCEMERKGFSERLALIRAARKLHVSDPSTRGLAHKLVFEATRRQNFLDYMVNAVLTRHDLSSLHPKVRAFLRLYAYDTKILGNDDYEAAAATARLGRSILGWRRLRPAEEALGALLSLEPDDALRGLSDADTVSLRFYQPRWFVTYCFKLLGRHEALRYFQSTLTPPPTYIRLNTLKASKQKLLEQIDNDGITVETVERLPHTYKVTHRQRPLVRTASFRRGMFFIQDKASSLASAIAAPRPNMTVIDVCAAPGAKTSHAAQLMENRGVIYSLDYSNRRIGVWTREMRRMGVDIAAPMVADAYNPLPLQGVHADLVMVDPPCTSTGAFGRMPSAKWRLSKRSLRRMATIQGRILNHAAAYVKESGSLVYSTCSITVEENEMVMERFLTWHPEFAPVETAPRVGLPGLRGQTRSQRLYPHIHGCNGFFIAKLTKQH